MKRPEHPPAWRQPVHTLYGGAHLFRSDTVRKMGVLAERQMVDTVPDCFSFAMAFGLAEKTDLPQSRAARTKLLKQFSEGDTSAQERHPRAWSAFVLYERVLAKLKHEAVEDFRVDFEDGYGVRPNAEEDAHAVQSASAASEAMARDGLPPFFGLRIRPLSSDTAGRALRTLDLFLNGLLERTSGLLPSGFVVTLPKVGTPDHVSALADHLERIEQRSGLEPGAVRIELMVEEPGVLGADGGGSVLASLVRAGRGRVRGLHLGLYDLLSSLGVVSSMQRFDHPSADHLRTVTSAAAAAEAIWVSDGAVNTIPVGPHRSGTLTRRQKEENARAVVEGWKDVHARVLHSLRFGFYQGWDLHPSQLVPRYTAVFALFLSEYDPARRRLMSFLEDHAHARRDGQVFDDIATGRGLLQFFARGYSCGALTDRDIERTGLSPGDMRSGSFATVLGERSLGDKKKGAPKGPRSRR